MGKGKEFQTRYPGYNVLDKWSSRDWDDQTREEIRKRLEEVPPIRFFTPDDEETLEAIVECIVPQPDKIETRKITVVPWIDEKPYKDKRDGYRYEDLPGQREAWRLGLKGINQRRR